MKKDDLYPTNKSINIFYNTGKNTSPKKLDHNFNTFFVPKKSSHSKKYKLYPKSRNFSKLYNSNRKYEIDNLYFNSLINDNSQIKNVKLGPLFKRTIYNSENKKRISENQKNKRDYNYYSKNQSIQLDLEDEIENSNNKNRKKKNLIVQINLIVYMVKAYLRKNLKEIIR